MPTPTPCHDAFDAAQVFRQQVPLGAGTYKLREGVAILGRMKDCVGTIGDKVKNGEKFGHDEALNGCLGHERGQHLKGMPKEIADILGKMIVPSIAELAADGVPPAKAAGAYRQALNDVQDLLWDCEKVHQRLTQSIAHEYGAMRHGRSDLHDLLHRAQQIGQRALDLADAHKAAA